MPTYRLLGQFGVMRDGRLLIPRSARVLNTLALLVVRANSMVSVDALIEELWGPAPSRSAAGTAQTYIYLLRRWLDSERIGIGGAALVTRSPGYVFEIDTESVDITSFNRLTNEGRALLRQNDPSGAADKLRSALDMWTGPVMSNVRAGDILSQYVVALDESRNRVLDLRIEADLRLGRYRDIIGELRALVAASPYNEWYHCLLMSSLALAGRII
jgi:DNA-binding SARP family transcriptional activator